MSDSQTVPAAVNDSAGFGAGDDLSFLDDPANLVTSDSDSDADGDRASGDPETPVTPAAADDTSTEEEAPAQTATDGVFKGLKPAVVAILKHLAKQEALNLDDPRDFKYARMIAEKENRIRELSLAQEPPEGERSYLDAFRDPTLPETPAPGANGQGAPPAAPPYRQLADTWQDESAFYEDWMDAFEMPESPEKPKRVSDVMFGFVDVAMRSQHLPAILSMVNQVIDARVGPAVRQADEVREAQSVRGVIDTLAQQKGFEEIESLFEPATDGALEYQGKQIADTWVNRAVIAFPHILKISVQGRTPAESKRLTSAEQYAAAYTVMKALRSQSSDPTTLNRGVATGIAIERSKRDRTRQGLNAGKTNGVPAGDRVFDDILKAGDGTTSFASVFK